MSSHTKIHFPKITKIHLQNFQAIAGPTDINLGDITFLMGPNSVGKSAVHDAIKFFQHVLEKGYGDRSNPETMGRRYDRANLDEDESPLCCVGIEIEFDKFAVKQVFGDRMYNVSRDEIQTWEKVLHQCLDQSGHSGRIELRLTFNKKTKNEPYEDQLEIKNNTTKLEVRINGREEPFLVIGEQDNYNFFDYLCLYLPDDYVELISNIDNVSTDEMDQYLGQYAEFHMSLYSSWDPDESIHKLLGVRPSGKPKWFFSKSICEVDLKQNSGKTLTQLTQASLQKNSLLENHVLSESNGILTHRGVFCDLRIKNRDQMISFKDNNCIKPFSLDLLGLEQFNSEAPQISPEKISDIAIRSEKHVKILNGFLGRLIDLFLSALHISHVPANRPIIDSHESVNIKDEFDWYDENKKEHAQIESEDIAKNFIIKNYPKYQGGFQSKIVNQRDSFSFKGYEYAIAEYAWRTICKDSKEKYTDLPEEYIWFYQLPKRWEDFPNEAIEKYLPSLSRYTIKQEVHKVVPFFLDKEASTSGSNLTRFRVHDSILQQTYDFSDLGSGISFVFPILVALGESDMTFIEQPELHLHPKAQAEIGDVLLAARAENRRSIVETHSEQMILQISKRIPNPTCQI